MIVTIITKDNKRTVVKDVLSFQYIKSDNKVYIYKHNTSLNLTFFDVIYIKVKEKCITKSYYHEHI